MTQRPPETRSQPPGLGADRKIVQGAGSPRRNFQPEYNTVELKSSSARS